MRDRRKTSEDGNGNSRLELSVAYHDCLQLYTEQQDVMFFTGTTKTELRNSVGLGLKVTKLPEGIPERIHFDDMWSLSQQPFIEEINRTFTR